MSVLSNEAEPSRCGQCQDAVNVLGHLEENAECREAVMREKLPRHLQTKYLDNRDLLLLDLSLAINSCLNTGGCSLPDGVIQVNIGRREHLSSSPECLEFYRSAPVFAELDVDTDNLQTLVSYLRNRMNRNKSTKSKENQGFSQLMGSEMSVTCHRCGLLGPMGTKFDVRAEVRGGEEMVCKKPVCLDEGAHVDLQPNTLAIERREASTPIAPGHEDHLVAVRTNNKDTFVLLPAHAVQQDQCVQPDVQIEENQTFLVVVPNTQNAVGRLKDSAKRAAEEWDTLKLLASATLGPRTMLLGDFGEFVQAVSMLHRFAMAFFRRSCVAKMSARGDVATGPISSRSPKKCGAIFLKPKFRDIEAHAIQDTLAWSDSAQVVRLAESEARSSVNGRIKNKVRVKLLSHDLILWSDKLKDIMARSFNRKIEESGGRRVLTCEGGCNMASCAENHPDANEFLTEKLKGIGRLARIPLILNYLKAKVECFEKAILQRQCEHYDFKIVWDKFSWNVHMVGHIWTKRRQNLNEKVARQWFLREIDIVRRILARSEDLETVSLNPQQLERR